MNLEEAIKKVGVAKKKGWYYAELLDHLNRVGEEKPEDAEVLEEISKELLLHIEEADEAQKTLLLKEVKSGEPAKRKPRAKPKPKPKPKSKPRTKRSKKTKDA